MRLPRETVVRQPAQLSSPPQPRDRPRLLFGTTDCQTARARQDWNLPVFWGRGWRRVSVMKYSLSLTAALLLALAGLAAPSPQQPAQKKQEPLVDKVRRSIDLAVTFLRSQQDRGTGRWEEAPTKIVHTG